MRRQCRRCRGFGSSLRIVPLVPVFGGDRPVLCKLGWPGLLPLRRRIGICSVCGSPPLSSNNRGIVRKTLRCGNMSLKKISIESA